MNAPSRQDLLRPASSIDDCRWPGSPEGTTLARSVEDVVEARLRGLMLAGLAGEAGPYRRLLDELGRRLRAYYGRRVPPGLDVEDLVQETLIAVHTRRSSYDTAQPFTAWAYAIARYKLIDTLRRRRLHLRAPAQLAEALFVEGGVDAAMAGRDLDRVLGGLPDRLRTLVRDVRIEGLSMREAAAKHSISEAAAKVAVHRALKSLQEGHRDVGRPEAA
jgi:RNA polymerase sigma-70 factor (ECF subfamily)